MIHFLGSPSNGSTRADQSGDWIFILEMFPAASISDGQICSTRSPKCEPGCHCVDGKKRLVSSVSSTGSAAGFNTKKMLWSQRKAVHQLHALDCSRIASSNKYFPAAKTQEALFQSVLMLQASVVDPIMLTEPGYTQELQRVWLFFGLRRVICLKIWRHGK